MFYETMVPLCSLSHCSWAVLAISTPSNFACCPGSLCLRLRLKGRCDYQHLHHYQRKLYYWCCGQGLPPYCCCCWSAWLQPFPWSDCEVHAPLCAMPPPQSGSGRTGGCMRAFPKNPGPLPTLPGPNPGLPIPITPCMGMYISAPQGDAARKSGPIPKGACGRAPLLCHGSFMARRPAPCVPPPLLPPLTTVSGSNEAGSRDAGRRAAMSIV